MIPWRNHLLLLITFLFIAVGAHAQWVRAAQSQAFSRANATVANASGDVYTAGVMTCITAFDGDSLLNNSCGEVSFPPLPATQIDAFLARHDQDGNLVWVQHYPGDVGNKLFVNDIALDASGNCYITGAYTDNLDLKHAPILFNGDNTTEFFLVKVLPDGVTDWVVTFPADDVSESFAEKLAVTGNAVYITGFVRGDYQIGAFADSVGNDASFIAAFDLDGNSLWVKGFKEINANGASRGKAITAFDDDVWVFSRFADSVKIEMDTIRPPGSLTLGGVINQYDAAGNLVDQHLTTTPFIEDMRVHLPDASLYITGRAENITAIGPDTLFYGMGTRAFVSRHELDANLNWVVPLTATPNTILTGSALDVSANGYVYAAGIFSAAALNAPTSSVTGGSGQNGYVLRLDSSGDDLWLQQVGGAGEDAALSVSAPDDTHVFVSGFFSNYIRVAGEELASPGTNNGFIARVDICPQLVADMLSPDSTFVCRRDSALFQVTDNAGYSYQWFRNGSPVTGTAADLYVKDAGTYYARITGLGCTKRTPIAKFFLNPLPDSTVTTNDPFENCAGDSVKLSGPLGRYSFQWFDNTVMVPGGVQKDIKVFTDGDYYLQIMDSLNCRSVSDTFYIRFSDYPLDTLLIDGDHFTICSGDSLALQADTTFSNFTYRWRRDDLDLPKETLSVLYAKESGIYNAVIQNVTGCETITQTDTVVVQESPMLDLNETSVPNEICQGETIRLVTTPVIGQTYQWIRNSANIPGAFTNALDISTPGTYEVRVRNALCERVSAPFTLMVNPLPVAAIVNNTSTAICQGDNFFLRAQEAANVDYQWLRNGQVLGGASGAQLRVAQTGNYTVRITNEFTCSSLSTSTSILVNLPPPATITPQSAVVFCAGESVSLGANAGTLLTYQWERDGNPVMNATSINFTASANGNYTVRVTNRNNCTRTSQPVAVQVIPIPVATLSSSTGMNSICERDSLLLLGGNDPSYTYTWFLNEQAIPHNTSQFYAKLPGDYNVVASVGSCRDTSSTLKLTVRPNPLPVISRNEEFLSIALFGSIQWYNDGVAIPGAKQQAIRADANGNYTVSVSNQAGCTAWSDPLSMCLPVPVISRTKDVLTFSVDAQQFTWKYGGIPINGATQRALTAQQSGDYTVVVTDDNGCTMETNPVTVCIPYPYITRDPVSGVLYGNPNPGLAYQWFFEGEFLAEATTQVHIPDGPGIYTVEVTDPEGCTSISEPFVIEVITGAGDALVNQVRVYPNPTVGVIHIETPLSGKASQIVLVDVNGKALHREVLLNTHHEIDVSTLSSGVYWIMLKQGERMATWKVVKK